MAMDILDPRVVDAAANGNFKATLDLSTQTTQQMGINQQAHANRLSMISEGVLTEALGQRAGNDPTEAVSQARTLEGSLSTLTAQMGMVVSAIQQLSKTAGNTPPVTGQG